MTLAQQLITVGMIVLGTMATRFLPFLLVSRKKPTPKFIRYLGVALPFIVPATGVFFFRQYTMGLPSEIMESGRIDGCSEFGIYWRIFLPLSKPALAVVALFHFMWAWKDFMGPLIYLTDKSTFTLSLGLFTYQSQHGGSEWHYLMAASTLMILPVILLCFFTQKTFSQGISTTGMKG